MTCFEGPEKRLRVDVQFDATSPFGDLRCAPPTLITALLTAAGCEALSARRCRDVDEYVLSESSLFVAAKWLLLKTCGTTRPLAALDALDAILASVSARVVRVLYTRKNFLFPNAQHAPHRSFDDEVECLRARFPEGVAVVLGAAEHERLYVYETRVPTTLPPPPLAGVLVEIMMHALDDKVMSQFFSRTTKPSPAGSSDEEATDDDVGGSRPSSRPTTPMPTPTPTRTRAYTTTMNDALELFRFRVLDEHAFEPCGYSMNGTVVDSSVEGGYVTVHVTPEAHCSYVSLETNVPAACYQQLVSKVIGAFRPSRFSVAVHADDVESAKALRRFAQKSVRAEAWSHENDDAALASAVISTVASETRELVEGALLMHASYDVDWDAKSASALASAKVASSASASASVSVLPVELVAATGMDPVENGASSVRCV